MIIHDVSAATDRRVIARRTLSRVGFILHTTSGTNSLRWLQGDSASNGTPASADYLVTRTGDAYKIVPPGYYGYHAGTSSTTDGYNHGSEINERYIGIEIENNDAAGETPTDLQYQGVAQIIRLEAQSNNLSPIRLYTHANIALPFGRRSDPVRTDLGRIFYYTSHPTPFMLT